MGDFTFLYRGSNASTQSPEERQKTMEKWMAWFKDMGAKGLIKGASLKNAVVLDDTDILSGDLRWSDEFVRHKAMDCVGDLALAGARVRARIVAVKPSHRGTVTLVREMVKAGRKEKGMYTIEDIMKVLPHRYPFLLVDRILEIEEKKRIVGLKNTPARPLRANTFQSKRRRSSPSVYSRKSTNSPAPPFCRERCRPL